MILVRRILMLASNTNRRQLTTAGIIVIGDEILKGQTQDTNSYYLTTEIRKMGILVKKISVIGDVIEEVAEEVRVFSPKFNHVVMTGGIGPTHDDITYEAVAYAFHQPLVLNETLKEMCFKFYNTDDVNFPGMKMAYIPKGAKLNFRKKLPGETVVYPTVSMGNVYMFAGIPEHLKKSFSGIKDVCFKNEQQFFTKILYVNAPEYEILKILNKVVHDYPYVQVGSYPKLFHKKYKVKVTVESLCEKDTKQVYEVLIALLPKDSIVNVEEIEKPD